MCIQNSDYAKVNPTNYHPVFTKEQISASLHTMQLYEPVLRTTVLMDLEQLNTNILTSLHSDPTYIDHQDDPNPIGRCPLMVTSDMMI